MDEPGAGTELEPSREVEVFIPDAGSYAELGANRFILFQDDTGIWCAAPPGFRDFVIDPAGWGNTREEAVSNLLADSEFLGRAQQQCWPDLKVEDFVEVPEPDGAKFEAFFMTDDPRGQRMIRRRSFRVLPGGKAKL